MGYECSHLPNCKTNFPFATYCTTQGGVTNFRYVQTLPKDTIIDGDFCEWNDSEYTERVVSKIYHKITYNDNVFDINITGESDSMNPLGYYYQVHHPITIKVFSSYIGAYINDRIIPFKILKKTISIPADRFSKPRVLDYEIPQWLEKMYKDKEFKLDINLKT